MHAGKRAGLVILLCLFWAIPAHAEMIQGYPNLPGATPSNAFSSAPTLDTTVAIPLIGETRLEAPTPSAAALAAKAQNQIGVAVDTPPEQRGLPALALDTAWTKVGERRYARLTIRSANAKSLRAGVVISSGFPGRILSVSIAGKVGSELKRTAGVSWSSTSEGDTLTLLVEIPADYHFREGDIAIPIVSHIDSDPLSARGNGFANINPNTATCTVDLACANSGVYKSAGASVMKILFTKDGNTYGCSGTLLADSARSYKPYVYTANHCIGSQAVADSVITYWNLQYANCNAYNDGMPDGVVKLSNGAQLLHNSVENDHAFLLLNDSPPAGAIFSGWNSDALSAGISVAAISHPMGDVKKIASGSGSDPITGSITLYGIKRSSIWQISITHGALQTGSSGGGLFTCDGQSCYLRGGAIAIELSQICASYYQNAYFSRFDVAYPSLKRWLGTPVPTALIFYGWPSEIDSNTSFPIGTITARFSDGSLKRVSALLSSSNTNLISIGNDTVTTGLATANTPVTLSATYTENGITVTSSTIINVLAPNLVIKTTPAISAGNDFSLSLKSNGTVWGWGTNRHYVLGRVSYWGSHIPRSVTEIADVTALSSRNHVVALKNDGTVWIWGFNPYGEAGFDISLNTPTQVNGISNVSAVAAGRGYSVALKPDGTVWSWGQNNFGQFGDNTSGTPVSLTPIQAKGIADAKSIAAGGNHTVALLKDGTVAAWGYNRDGQLGVVTSDQCLYASSLWACSKTPVKMTGLNNVVAIAAGLSHSVALKEDGTVWAWGLNSSGQLGDGTTINSPTPEPVPLLTDVIAIAAGDEYSLVLKSDGTVWTWGRNDYQQLGYSTTGICPMPLWGNVPCSKSPSQVTNLSGVSAISGGGAHSLALKTDGSVWAWGHNDLGQLGSYSSESTVKAPARVVIPGGFLNLGTNKAPQPTKADQAVASTATTLTLLDCLFTWAEGKHPELLSPSGGNTETLGIFRYRHYSATRAYLGLSSSDDHLYYIGPLSADRQMDLGTISEWYATAGCR